MRAHWKVVDGVLVFDGKGSSLCTRQGLRRLRDARGLEDREGRRQRHLSPRLAPGPDLGRPTPEPGRLRRPLQQPEEPPEQPVEEGRQARRRVEHLPHHDDRRAGHGLCSTTSWSSTTSSWRTTGSGTKPIYPTGQIELQNHGNFLYLPEHLHPRDPARRRPRLRCAEAERGRGLRAALQRPGPDRLDRRHQGLPAEDGKIIVHPEPASGNLYTAKEYERFHVPLRVQADPGANNGLGIRAPLDRRRRLRRAWRSRS